MFETIYGIYGASGFGRETMPIARACAMAAGARTDDVYFIDDSSKSEAYGNEGFVNGQRVVTYAQFLAVPAARRLVAVAIADAQVRERLAQKLETDEIEAWSLFAENSLVLDNVQIGEGAILSPFSMLTSNIKIGRYFHANIYSYVAHDCVVGDFVTFAPGVKCNGNVVIEDFAYVGTGAILKQGRPDRPLTIGRGAVVGMGAVVTKDVPAGDVVVGNPARELRRD
ncbi:MAG: acetyltransferase [Mesorhizobium sp.]